MIDQAVRAGTLDQLQADGKLLTKVGSIPVVVFWHDGTAYAIEDRCPHLGFPLHQGTVESGLVTCHWHHARFDLVSGCTLDMWADDARGFTAEVRDREVFVAARADADPIGHLQARLRDGLEEQITLVIAKSVLGLLDAKVNAADIVRTGVDFGTTYRGSGWGAGLTVLVAMANLFPYLDEDDRALALVHGLSFVANDTGGQSPRFPVGPLATSDVPVPRLASWYRRFVDTRSSDSAERTLETALADPADLDAVEQMMFAAVSDHVFIDGGHTIDFTNKAFEAVEMLGTGSAGQVLPTLVMQTARAQREEEFSEWRHPRDLVQLAERTTQRLAEAGPDRAEKVDVGAIAWELIADEPDAVGDALVSAHLSGANDEEIGRALAYAAALRIVRFHTRNDHADWDTVHHSFTAANA
jgi:nitrite reductase/ring-hydroxylating ferredoxin subunit